MQKFDTIQTKLWYNKNMENQRNMISNDRLQHSISVARLMKTKSEEMGKDQEFTMEMFCLGYIHDIGYEFDSNHHNNAGSEILKLSNYKYWREVKYHGEPNSEYDSFELNLLNWADMHTDSKGQYVSFEERLNDIGNRYGFESQIFKRAKETIKNIKGIK